MKKFSEYEQKEVDDLYNIIKHKHKKIHIKDIDIVINDIMHSLETDNRVKHNYNKKNITDGVLYKLYINGNNIHDHKKFLNNCDNKINYKLDQIRLNKIKKERKSCMCIIL